MYYDDKSKELKDREIIHAIKSAAKDYENGAIIEARDVLADIVYAIDSFFADYGEV